MSIKTYYAALIANEKDERYALARTAATFNITPNQVKRELKREPVKRPRKPAPVHA